MRIRERALETWQGRSHHIVLFLIVQKWQVLKEQKAFIRATQAAQQPARRTCPHPLARARTNSPSRLPHCTLQKYSPGRTANIAEKKAK
jgi:hypothetical protein